MDSTVHDALVVQGGGMRGAYAAGALVHLHGEAGLAFDAVWATSSGAASAAYAVAGQREGLAIWRDHLHGARLVHPVRFALGGDALDLSYLVDDVFRRRVPLDVARLRRAATALHVPLTDAATGEGRYFDLTRDPHPFAVLRAAMALPGAVRRSVRVRGHDYVDGGLAHPLPLAAALDAGARRITVVLTRPIHYTPGRPGRFGRWLVLRDHPGLARAMADRHRVYTDALALLHAPRPGVRMRIIAPPAGLRLERWTTRRDRLVEAIAQGTRDAAALFGPTAGHANA